MCIALAYVEQHLGGYKQLSSRCPLGRKYIYIYICISIYIYICIFLVEPFACVLYSIGQNAGLKEKPKEGRELFGVSTWGIVVFPAPEAANQSLASHVWGKQALGGRTKSCWLHGTPSKVMDLGVVVFFEGALFRLPETKRILSRLPFFWTGQVRCGPGPCRRRGRGAGQQHAPGAADDGAEG